MKVCAVIRQLPGMTAAVHCVIEPPSYDVDDLEGYFEDRAKDLINQSKEAFIEFRQASFSTHILNTV